MNEVTKGTSCATPTYVGKVLCSARESSPQHTFRPWGCRVAASYSYICSVLGLQRGDFMLMLCKEYARCETLLRARAVTEVFKGWDITLTGRLSQVCRLCSP